MTDSMLWLNGSTVLSTERRALTNEFLRAKGITVIVLPQEQIQPVWQASQARFANRELTVQE